MVALVSSNRFDSRDLSILSLIQTAQFSNQTTTGYRANFGRGDYVGFTGFEFAYFGDRPSQGKTTQFTVLDNNEFNYKAIELWLTIDDFIYFSQIYPGRFSEEILKRKDTLVGSNGVDYLQEFGGNDTYVVRDPGDRVIEAARDGFDTITTSISFTLAVSSIVEALFASPGSQSIDLVGSVIANQIKGNAGLNAINGSGGRDAL